MSGFARKLAIIAVLAFVLSCTASLAYAASPDGLTTVSPSFTHTYDPSTGASAWTYKDAYDSAAKTEGSYAAFDNGTLYNNPHGGYDSTTNKCKVCHAVHRAEGAYYLLRADTQDDACSYCHIGGSAHSRKVVYDLAGTIYTPNGHSIGASSIIPDSSVKQWLEDVELKTFDADGNEVTETVEVRRYYERRNKMFRFGRHHGQSATAADTTTNPSGSDRNGYSRIGPLALRCMNCHQPHNAIELIWKPTLGMPLGHFAGTTYTPDTTILVGTGYKLLRASPSGSVADKGNKPGYAWRLGAGNTTTETVDDVMLERLAVGPIDGYHSIGSTDVVRVPEDPTIGPSNTGYPYTIWTRWSEVPEEEFHGAVYRDPSVVTPFSLSVWCADCHNLNIGYWEETQAEFGGKLHADRTHPAPYAGAYNGPAQCYSCHRNDRPLVSGTVDEYGTTYTAAAYTADAGDGLPRGVYHTGNAYCEQCHFGTASYFDTMRAREAAGQYAYYDFPHSGGTNYIKMLGPWTAYLDGSGTMQTTKTTISSTNLDAVCKRCHPGIGVRH